MLTTDFAGTVLERRLFEPFGEVLDQIVDAAAWVPTSFTGQLFHDELDLYNFGARWYDSEAGRFASVDPIIQTAADPQTHNPYGYVRYNPVSNVDPNGLGFFKKLGKALLDIVVGLAVGHRTNKPRFGSTSE